MFSSPAINVFSQENVGSVPKKPGTSNAISRKPFIDRPVNGASPEINKNLKPDHKFKKPETLPGLQNLAENDDLFFYDTCSYKDIQGYVEPDALSRRDTLNILQSYCNYTKSATPPPELSPHFDMFVKMPTTDFFFKSEDTYDIETMSVGEISLPDIDSD